MKLYLYFIVLFFQSYVSAELNTFHNCDLSAKDSFYLTDKFKNRPISFSNNPIDVEVKNLLANKLNKNDLFLLKDLDKLFDWDRRNGMKYIYKILEVMDNNYKINENNDIEFKHYKKKHTNICITID
jgi:hypothetical protein